jgi:co-chaperonin GroES (HSP10)
MEPKHRKYNIGNSDYSDKKIQPWDIWKEYNLNGFDADIVKRVLRNKKGESRKMDYEKIIHVCEERIHQIDKETEIKMKRLITLSEEEKELIKNSGVFSLDNKEKEEEMSEPKVKTSEKEIFNELLCKSISQDDSSTIIDDS